MEPTEPERRPEQAWTREAREAYVQKLFEAFIARSLWVDHSAGNGHGDVRNIDRTIN